MKFSLLLCIVFSYFFGFSQTQKPSKIQAKIDSLDHIIKTNNLDIEVAEALVNKGFMYMKNIDTVNLYANKAIRTLNSVSGENNSSKTAIGIIAEANYLIGRAYFSQGDYNNAISPLTKAVKKYEAINDTANLATTTNLLAISFHWMGSYSNAIFNYKKSYPLAISAGDQILSSAILINMGDVYFEQLNPKAALKNYQESLAIKKILNHELGIGNCHKRIGDVLVFEKKYDEALYHYEQAIKTFKSMNDTRRISEGYLSLGNHSLIQGKYQEALKYGNLSLDAAIILNKETFMVKPLAFISNVYSELGNSKQALLFGNKALNVSNKTSVSRGKIEVYEALHKGYSNVKNYREAYKNFTLYTQLKDSIVNQANQKEALTLRIENDFNKKHLSDSLAFIQKEQLKDIQYQSKLDKEASQRYFLYGGLIFLLILGGGAFRGYQRKKKDHNLILQQKEEVDKAHLELEVKNEEITDSIQYAKRIQNAILPPSKIVKEYLQESFILYKPKDIVAGDFYWMEQVKGKTLFAAADCTGHGVPGAMVSVVCNNALNRSVREYGLSDPGKILDKTREIVIEEFEKSDEDVKDGMDIALCSIKGNILKYAGAHNPLWIIRNGEIIETKANKQPIGQFDNPEPYTTHTFILQKGDSVYIFSDGYVDQFGGEKGKKFKAKAFRELLLSIQKQSMEKQKELIDSAFENWRGNLEQIDDVCVIGVRV